MGCRYDGPSVAKAYRVDESHKVKSVVSGLARNQTQECLPLSLGLPTTLSCSGDPTLHHLGHVGEVA